MKIYDLVELSFRNLREAKLRNSLTTLGISVGVASLVAMLSLGVGLQRLANRQLGRSGLFDSIIITSRVDFGREPRRAQGEPEPPKAKPLDEDARKSIASLPNVLEVNPDIRVRGEFRFGPDTSTESAHFAWLAGLPASARQSESFDELQGSFFSSPNAAEAVILSDLGRELLNLPESGERDEKLTKDQASQLLGKELVFRYAERQDNQKQTSGKKDDTLLQDMGSFSVVAKEQPLKIVGIVNKEPGGAFRANGARVLVPMDFAESLNMIQPSDLRTAMRPGQGKVYLTLIARVNKSSEVEAVEVKIKKEGFNTFSILDASKNLTRFFKVLDLFLGIFGSLALAVSSLGIINTLVMAVLERRREIGIMKAIGASNADVKSIFFHEAGVMGLVGGAFGVLLGWAIGRIINFATNVYLLRQQLSPESFWYVPWWLVVSAVGFSIFVSLVAGLYPAARAARLDPVKALRHE